ncbi:hypothetical protein K443DRAFT_269504 [Laccaria amethystina LaAM-08-1]|jgi:hypothetical protein|uniref:Unplaced genomic scaffold K443scaffold_171, whole genome shotgun sequence n=1 Tax=Laccaria amethystina LaAM-08-1 TaxID=1095629 RepID=A0A0C9XGY0_9AGAR|nr:hypothetical protein K443DRAFT_269504 [Laccaria amethystina LaAM-08-1]
MLVRLLYQLSSNACSAILTQASLVRGWGWHGGPNQQVGDEALRLGPLSHVLIYSVYTVETHPTGRQR